MNHYYPFGGLMGESTAGGVQPYKYNGKELDRMHGLDLFDYGARHYDAAIGRWWTVDPLAEKYYGMSPYVYVANNPVRFIDKDGRDIDIASLTDKNHQKALNNLLSTSQGYTFVSRYMRAGQTINIGGNIYRFNETGDRAKDVLWFRSSEMRPAGLNRTFTKNSNKLMNQTTLKDNIRDGVNQVIDLKIGLDEKTASITIGHETFVHADKDADRLNNIDNKLSKKLYIGSAEYIKDVYNIENSTEEDHRALSEDKVQKFKDYAKSLSRRNNDNTYLEKYEEQVRRYK